MHCVVCGETVHGQEVLACFGCAAPHHFECWAYAGRCARYACRCREAVPRVYPRHVRPRRAEESDPDIRTEKTERLLSGDWVHGWEMRRGPYWLERVLLVLAALFVAH